MNTQIKEIAVVEEVKSSVEPKNEKKMGKRKGEKTLKTQLKEAKKMLEKFKKMNVTEAVIQAQQAEIDRLDKEIGQSEEKSKKVSGAYVDIEMTFEVFDEETYKRKDVVKRIAFVKNNRPINHDKVDNFMALFANGKYEKAYPIIAIEANKFENTEYVLTDVNGNKITSEMENYLVVLDGQHRATALMQIASTGKGNQIPNVYLKDINAESVAEYLVDINNVGTSWTATDKLVVVALTKKDELFENIAEKIKEGFNPSTATKIYTRKTISSALLNKILKGESYTLPKGSVIDIERGNKFINICKSAGMGLKKLTNRFYIGGFNQFATARSDEEAFEALNYLVGKLNKEMLNTIRCEDDFCKILKEAFEAGRYEKSETSNEETVKEAA